MPSSDIDKLMIERMDENILLIDDIITTGKSVEAFSKLINNKTKPKIERNKFGYPTIKQ